jgi:hypothetical protein
MYRFLLAVIVFLGASVAGAQQTIYDETRVLYRSQWSGGITVHGDGWGIQAYRGIHRTAKHVRLYGLEIVGMKHPKEVKSFNPYYDNSRGYFYGKTNALTIIRPTIGGKHLITDKIRRSGVEVNWVWGIGPSIGLAKPVYLQIGKPDAIPYVTIVTERYDPSVHDVQNIYGRASWFKGVGEIVPYFGGFGRFGFNFEHSGHADGIKAIEVGCTIDAYPEVVPIMAEMEGVTNKQFFFEFYLAIQFGKKYIQ